MKPALKKLFAAAGIVVVTGVGAYFLNKLFGTVCPFKAITDIPCPGCGMTRAYLAVLRGYFKGAFFWHPLFPLTPVLAGALAVYSFGKKPLLRKIAEITLIVVAVLFVVVWIFRLVNGWR